MTKRYFSYKNNNNADNEGSDTLSSTLAYSGYPSFETSSPQLSSGSPYRDTDSISEKSKKIRKKRNTYQKIDDETRIKLLDAVQQGETLKAAAKRYGINYSSAKSILHTYRKEGRILKKSAQERTTRRRNKASPDMEMSPIYLYKQCQEDFNGGQEASTYQTYHSPLSQQKSEPSPVYGALSDDETPKAGVSGLAINSFGGFLKVGSQPQPKGESLNSTKSPASTFVLKLESQGVQKVQCVDTKNVQQGGNWHLSVNVHAENHHENTPNVYKYIEEPHIENHEGLRSAEGKKSFEHFYMNYGNSPLSLVGMKKEEHEYEKQFIPKEFDAFDSIVAGLEDNHAHHDRHSCDVSGFLNSSPAYAFQHKSFTTHEQYGGSENYSAVEHYKGLIEPQDLFYEGLKKGPYMENFRMKLEEGASGLIKTAGLSSY